MYRYFGAQPTARAFIADSPTTRAINQSHRTHIQSIYLCICICRFTFCALTANVNVRVRWQLPLPHSREVCTPTGGLTKRFCSARVFVCVTATAFWCSINSLFVSFIICRCVHCAFSENITSECSQLIELTHTQQLCGSSFVERYCCPTIRLLMPIIKQNNPVDIHCTW